jgi:hypothetical protein
MPRKKLTERKLSSLLSPELQEFFACGNAQGEELFLLSEERAKKIWRSISERFLKKWGKEHPGSRPWAWWRYDAPELRQRVGGKGNIQSDFLAIIPTFHYGIPTGWLTAVEVRLFPELKGKEFDAANPPVFESQTSYLQCHNLLGEIEKKYVSNHPELLEPEKVEIE